MFVHSGCYACFRPDDTLRVGLQNSQSRMGGAELRTTSSGTGLNQIHASSALSCLHLNFFRNLGGREDSQIRRLMMQHQPWPAQVN